MNIMPVKDSVQAKHHTPVYSVHRYFARRPHNVFQHLLKHYLPLGKGIVLDPFSGGGVTLVEGLTLGYQCIGYEINPVASFIIENQLKKTNFESVELNFVKCIEYCKTHLEFTYQYDLKDVYWYEWTTYTLCPNCKNKTQLKPNLSLGGGLYTCGSCAERFRPKGVSKDDIEPTRICIFEGDLKKDTSSIVSVGNFVKHHQKIHTKIKKSKFYLSNELKRPIPKCNLEKESALHKKHFLFFEDFITEKNQAWIICFLEAMDVLIEDNDIKQSLLYILSSSIRYMSRFSSMNEEWRKSNRPLEWAKSNFWTPYTFVELNPEIALSERLDAYKRAQKDLEQRSSKEWKRSSASSVLTSNADYAIINKPSQNMLEVADDSIDFILTDPPYGSYLNYSELTNFWACWLEKADDKFITQQASYQLEAITSRKKHDHNYKSFHDYEELLKPIFVECFRVLKNKSYLCFTFNNKEPEAWIALLRAIKMAGFHLPENGIIYQDGVESYKRTLSLRRKGAIHGDFIYSFYKDTNKKNSHIKPKSSWESILDDILNVIIQSINATGISNTDLYLEINKILLPKIYESINLNEYENFHLDQLNFKSLENQIKQKLKFLDGYWFK